MLNRYNYDLTRMSSDMDWDIMKISYVMKGGYLSPGNWTAKALEANLFKARDSDIIKRKLDSKTFNITENRWE